MWITLLYFFPALVIAITVHEWSHAIAATALGDDTPRKEGRVTLNPLAHMDPLGTLMLFLVSFGWGKPVQVNPRNFKQPVFHNILVAFAGPFSNLCMALVALLLLKYGGFHPLGPVWMFLRVFFDLNVILMIFNMLPIPPLDGGHVLEIFMDRAPWVRYLYLYGPTLLIGVLLVEYVTKIPLLRQVLGWLHQLVVGVLYTLT